MRVSISEMTKTILLLSMLLVPGFAADLQDWKNLGELKAGDRVGLVQTDMKRVEGVFGAADDAGITVDGKTVAKDQVVRVYRRSGMSRATRTMIGAAVGVGVGALMAETVGRYLQNESNGPEKGVWYGVGIGAGAGLGALSGSGYKTVYQKR